MKTGKRNPEETGAQSSPIAFILRFCGIRTTRKVRRALLWMEKRTLTVGGGARFEHQFANLPVDRKGEDVEGTGHVELVLVLVNDRAVVEDQEFRVEIRSVVRRLTDAVLEND